MFTRQGDLQPGLAALQISRGNAHSLFSLEPPSPEPAVLALSGS